MEDKDLNKMHWRDRWDLEASKKLSEYREFTERQLLRKIQTGLFDPYYMIWRAIGEKGTFEKASFILLDILYEYNENEFSLLRFHCATALFRIIKTEQSTELFDEILYSENRKESLQELEKIIRQKMNLLEAEKMYPHAVMSDKNPDGRGSTSSC